MNGHNSKFYDMNLKCLKSKDLVVHVPVGVEVFGRRVGWGGGGVSDMSYNCQPVYLSLNSVQYMYM